jgi:coenzyme F420-reducing hydrogenase beta subunit
MVRINTADKTKCCGCGACVVACPVQCIQLQPDDEGFCYPVINDGACTNCGRCLEVCGMQQPAKLHPAREAFAAWHADPEIRAKGTSGSVFTAFAETVLSGNGLVAGAAFSNDYRTVAHVLANSTAELDRLRGSKYVQSETTHCFHDIVKKLHDDHRVLFCGTPCQIASLRLLTRNNERLLTCDLVCHGVPSPAIFKQYLCELEIHRKAKVIEYQFRDKSSGWNFPKVAITFDNGTTTRAISWADPYFYGYSILRPCCYACPFTRMERTGDLTLADCWRVAASHPQYDDNKGTSLILVNTEPGRRLLDETRGANRLVCGRYDLDLARSRNTPLRQPAHAPSTRAAFFRVFQETGSFGQASGVFLRRKFIYRKRLERLIKYIAWPLLRRFQ